MKNKLFITSLILMTILSGCVNTNHKDKEDALSVESTDKEPISIDTYTKFYSDGQFKLTIVDTSIRKFEDIEEVNIKDNIKEVAEGKYVIYIDYIFEDKTIDSDISMSSYKINDLLPSAKNTKGKGELKLVSATNVVSGIENLKANEESIRAIFVSDEKIDQAEFIFDIKDKLERKNVYNAVLDLD